MLEALVRRFALATTEFAKWYRCQQHVQKWRDVTIVDVASNPFCRMCEGRMRGGGEARRVQQNRGHGRGTAAAVVPAGSIIVPAEGAKVGQASH